MGTLEWERHMKSLTADDWKKSVGPGWSELVERAYNILDAEDVYIWDVKEKFGGLRISYWSASQEANDAIWALEHESLSVCEMCGARGRPRPSGWIKTMCWRHWWPLKVRRFIKNSKFRFKEWRRKWQKP